MSEYLNIKTNPDVLLFGEPISCEKRFVITESKYTESKYLKNIYKYINLDKESCFYTRCKTPRNATKLNIKEAIFYKNKLEKMNNSKFKIIDIIEMANKNAPVVL